MGRNASERMRVENWDGVIIDEPSSSGQRRRAETHQRNQSSDRMDRVHQAVEELGVERDGDLIIEEIFPVLLHCQTLESNIESGLLVLDDTHSVSARGHGAPDGEHERAHSVGEFKRRGSAREVGSQDSRLSQRRVSLERPSAAGRKDSPCTRGRFRHT